MPADTMLLTACPHCRRRYRVRSDQVPPQGVRARCPHCGAIFPVVPGASNNNSTGASASNVSSDPGLHPGSQAWSNELEKGRPERGVIGEVRPRPQGGVEEGPLLTETFSPEASRNGSSEPANEQARSMARALASDLAAYHPRECEEGSGNGRLVSLLGSEIAASWELYIQEVGEEMARGTVYFREALNEFLNHGRDYF